MRYAPDATSPNVIVGSPANAVGAFSGQTIAGGGAAGSTCFDSVVHANIRPCANQATGAFATISGGESNVAAEVARTALIAITRRWEAGLAITLPVWRRPSGEGEANDASAQFATVAGESNNLVANYAATIGGGENNQAVGGYALVGGGVSNVVSGYSSTITGGYANTASGSYSFIAGGYANAAASNVSFVGGAQRLLHGKVECSCGQTIGRFRSILSAFAPPAKARTRSTSARRESTVCCSLRASTHRRCADVGVLHAEPGRMELHQRPQRQAQPASGRPGKRTGESDRDTVYHWQPKDGPTREIEHLRPDGPGLQGGIRLGGQRQGDRFPGCRRRRARRDPGNASPGAAERRADSGTAAACRWRCSSGWLRWRSGSSDDVAELRSALRQLRATSVDARKRSRCGPQLACRLTPRTSALTSTEGGCGASDAAAIFAGARVDLDLVAGGHEQWNRHFEPARELGGLRDLARRVALDRRLGVCDLADDGRGQLDRDRLALVERQLACEGPSSEGKAISVELPTSVVREVAYTEPAVTVRSRSPPSSARAVRSAGSHCS